MSLPKPYYDDGKGIVIYCGDAREILPLLEPVDLVLTDPPYGIGYDPGGFKKWNGEKSGWQKIAGDDQEFDPSCVMGRGKDVVIWGANYYSDKLPVGGWFCWDKRCSDNLDKMIGNPCEFAWNSSGRQAVARILHGGVVNADSKCGNNDKRDHPTQKPLKLMTWCLSFFPKAETILDPFMGSGTTLVAAKNLGRRCIGIELEQKYCDIAIQRLAQDVLDFSEVPL